MIVKFDLYNENDFEKTLQKEFKDISEAHDYARSQVGHPYLSFANFRLADGTSIYNDKFLLGKCG